MRLAQRVSKIGFALGLAVTAAFGCAESDELGDVGQLSGFGGDDTSSSASGDDTTTSTGAGPTSTTTSATGGSTTGGSTTSSTTGAGSSGSGNHDDECFDDGEGEPANDAEGGAVDLGTIDDCNWNGSAIVGTLDGADDVDWYVYTGDDVAGCSVEPQRTISMGARLCKFFECVSGDVEFDCPNGTKAASSPQGLPGCCADEPGQAIQMDDLNCTWTIDDDVVVYMRVDNPDGLACVSYGIDFHY
jgi:hypothetical protein